MQGGGAGWERATWTATAWKMKDSGKGELSGDKMAGGGNIRKSSSAAADKAGAGGCHGARPGNMGKSGGRQENQAGESTGVQGDYRGREASGVAQESPGVGEEEGVCEASGVAENPQGSRQ